VPLGDPLRGHEEWGALGAVGTLDDRPLIISGGDNATVAARLCLPTARQHAAMLSRKICLSMPPRSLSPQLTGFRSVPHRCGKGWHEGVPRGPNCLLKGR